MKIINLGQELQILFLQNFTVIMVYALKKKLQKNALLMGWRLRVEEGVAVPANNHIQVGN